MRLRKRMLDDLDMDIRDHLERETQGQHRAWNVAGRSAARGFA